MTGRLDAHGWEARIAYDPALFGVDQVRLMLRRLGGPGRAETVARIDGGSAEIHRYDPDTGQLADGAPTGLVLPIGVAEAIADAVRPGPSAELLTELRDALAVERARVDRMLPQVEYVAEAQP